MGDNVCFQCSKSGTKGSQKCGTCKKTDHKEADCPTKEKKCGNCGKIDHKDTDCPLKKKKCGMCGKVDHLEINCPLKKKCGACKQNGHREADCPLKKTKCGTCGKTDHKEADCPIQKKKTTESKEQSGKPTVASSSETTNKVGGLCFLCGQAGHSNINCPHAPWFKRDRCIECNGIKNHFTSCSIFKGNYCQKCGSKHGRNRLCPFVNARFVCYHCFSTKHTSAKCPRLKHIAKPAPDPETTQKQIVKLASKTTQKSPWEVRNEAKECFACGQRGHRYPDCPPKKQEETGKSDDKQTAGKPAEKKASSATTAPSQSSAKMTLVTQSGAKTTGTTQVQIARQV